MLATQVHSAALADRIRLPFVFDPVALADDLDRVVAAAAIQTGGNATAWIDHFVPQNYDGSWSVIPLRGVAGATHPVRMIYADPTATAFADGPLLAHAPHIRAVLERFACPLQTVRLMRLTPGSQIKPHRDHDLAAETGAARIHVPITTNPQVEFMLNDIRVTMAAGSAWYLRLADPHAVANRGPCDRVHLVIDCIADAWLLDLLRASDETA
ncbi:aspartyl/asparaginyl beta-hydroxylase domain-containing protein [Sphingomonas faeni]|uniref:aspartyl/asparaginyl beta-hydroxylase domain-containing protein n=1 Tax=Sphingomonas faeni TaxID=185950 RepID=UPI00336149CB